MLKVDIRKAFDTVSWDFVVKLLEAQGFPPLFITWIKECITSPRFSVAINGELAGFFPGEKGLRQGDSISPYLFIMIMEVLSKLLGKAVDEGGMTLHPLCQEPRITHLMFADDLLVFSDGSVQSVFGIKEVMALFKSWTGLEINPSKTEIFFGGYSTTESVIISDLAGFKVGSFPTRYLGLPLDPNRISFATLQPFLERITSKLNSWTVKSLSFAGKVRMVVSVIYGMVNFWGSVFDLPKRFYARVDSLCLAFLWGNRTSSAQGARVSWDSICKPKNEGGLGIRKLEEFQEVFRLKRVWNYFSTGSSIWIEWLKQNIFKRKSYWEIQTSQRLSPTVRGMISCRETVMDFLRCAVGDGRAATFWFDWWTDLGPLITALGERGPRDLRIPLSATVSTAVVNGNWFLPAARSEEALTLQIVLSTMTPPSASRGPDKYLWRNGDQYVPKFSTRATWNMIRVEAPTVSWHKLVWFKEEIPRCSFIAWEAILGRLPTRDRLSSWGLVVPLSCVLCSTGTESHDHLFFHCPYAVAIWSHFCASYLSAPPVSLLACSALLNQAPMMSSSGPPVVLKLLMQVITYVLWRERNFRIFRDTASTQQASINRVDRMIRDRLLSIPSRPPPAPSLLQIFFSFSLVTG